MSKTSTLRIKQEFAERLRLAVKWKHSGLSYRELAKVLEVSTTFISDMLNANKLPASDTGTRIAMKLGVGFEWLMTGRGPMATGSVTINLDHLSPKDQETVQGLVKMLEGNSKPS